MLSAEGAALPWRREVQGQHQQELCEMLTRQCMHPSMQMEDMAPKKIGTVCDAWKRPLPLLSSPLSQSFLPPFTSIPKS